MKAESKVKEVVEVKEFVLTMNQDEAEALHCLVGVTKSSLTYPASVYDEIHEKLDGAGVMAQCMDELINNGCSIDVDEYEPDDE